MRKAQLKTLPTERLVEEFRTLSAEHMRAVREGPLGDANRKYDLLVAIRRELRERGPDALHLLLSLLADPDPGTRCWAASSMLALAPHEAEPVLAELANTQRNSVGFEASMILKRWREGTFNPP